MGPLMDTLFDLDVPEPQPEESATVRRTKRQAAKLAFGVHPLTGLSLHDEAAPADDKAAAGRRCRNCRFHRVLSHHDSRYPKCLLGATEDRAPYAAHSEASDCRGWWPGCSSHEWGDPRVPDGMRWVPGDGPVMAYV